VIIPRAIVDDQEPPPVPTASPSPMPSPILPPAPTPRPDGASLLISNGARESRWVALTFDMGGRLEPALPIVDWLIANDVRATIFTTGQAGSETEVGQEVLRRTASHPELFTVGNHSWDHPAFTDLTAPEIVDQLNRTEAAVDAITGRSTRPFFRPPFGSHDAEARAAIGSAGWAYTVMWDVDTIDWKPTADGGPTSDDIEAKVLSRAQGGSIVLMHLGGYETLDALPAIVTGLRNRGLEPVTLAEMFLR
jgi:peptidoglycan/xylan/chitin deacetylase (PgdA/CDA1 family)